MPKKAVLEKPTSEPVNLRDLVLDAEAAKNTYDSETRTEAERYYFSLIQRETLDATEGQSLLDAAEDLGRSHQQILDDQGAVREFRKLAAAVESIPELQRKREEARNAKEAFLERIDLEWTHIESVWRRAEGDFQQAQKKPHELVMLAKRFPDLFTDTNPPRLRVAEPSTKDEN